MLKHYKNTRENTGHSLINIECYSSHKRIRITLINLNF